MSPTLFFVYIPEGFARVASPKMISDCHMLRMNVCDAVRQARRHAETRKRVDIYKSVGYICFFLSLSFYLFISISFFLSSPPHPPPPPPSPLLTRGARKKTTLHQKCDAGRQAGTQTHEKGLTFIRVRVWLARYGCRTDCL